MSLYRSQRAIKYIQAHRDELNIWPICIPSYRRPKPRILKNAHSNLPLVFFVRAEELNQYEYLRKKYRVVPIHNVTNIGETRAKIVKWAIAKGYDNIFMLDDDIQSVDYLYPGILDSGMEVMRAAYLNLKKAPRINPDAFRLWMLWLKNLSADVTLSAPHQRAISWSMKNVYNKDARYNSSQLIQCVHLNIKKLMETGISYRSSDIVGNEDIAIQYEIMTKGLKTVLIPDILYNIADINSHGGGCENASGISDPIKRYEHYCRLFLENVSGENHPGITCRVAGTGVKSIKFKWSYWREQ